MNRKSQPLRFRKDGTFRIMQVADIQESPLVCGDSIAFLRAALRRAQPDLVIFTGDQLKGYSPYFHMPGGKLKIGATLHKILAPLTQQHVPFVVTFGNHDAQAGLSNRQQMYYYLQYPECLNPVHDPENCGTSCLTVSGQDGSPIFALYVIDSNPERFAPVKPEQLACYRSTRDRLKAENGGVCLPALVFQHIPVPEFYELLKEVPKGTPHAVPAFGSRRGRFYALDEAKVLGGTLGEAPCVPAFNSGELSVLTEAGDVLGLYVGHDHRNSFRGRLHGIDVGYSPCCGFNTYGPGPDRAVRLFTLHEAEPRRYETHLLRYHELFGHKVSHPARDLLLDRFPATPEEMLPILLKTAAVTGSLAYLLHKDKNRRS